MMPQYPPQYAPRPVAPGLERRQKRGAFWAGFVGLNLINAGGSLVIVALLFGLIIAFVTALMRFESSRNHGTPSVADNRAFLDAIDQFGASGWIVAAALVGLLLVTAGLFVSYWILSAHGVSRPWAVTWSAVGISIPVLFILTFFSSIVGQVVGTVTAVTVMPPARPGMDSIADALGAGIALAVFGLVVSIAVVGAVGWLIWWWMAHVFRRKA